MLPSPGMFQGFLDRIAWEDYAREDFEEPMEEARRVEAPRTSRRRNFDEVDPDSEDEAEARGRSRRRIGFEHEGEARYRGLRRIRRQSFEEGSSLQEANARMERAREARAAEAAAAAQVDENIRRLRDEGVFSQYRTAA